MHSSSHGGPETRKHVDVDDYDRSIQFFGSLCVTDEDLLEKNLSEILSTIQLWIDTYHDNDERADSLKALIRTHLPTVLRLTTECPLNIIRDRCTEFMENLKRGCSDDSEGNIAADSGDRNNDLDSAHAPSLPSSSSSTTTTFAQPTSSSSLHPVAASSAITTHHQQQHQQEQQQQQQQLQQQQSPPKYNNEELIPHAVFPGPSIFISNSSLVPIDTTDEQRSRILVDVFQHDCRTSHMTRMFLFAPSYFKAFIRTFHFLMRCDGPLPLHIRYYIGIMASSRHRCKPLCNIQIHNFLAAGGDKSWLESIKNAPLKIQRLSRLNGLLAHQPYRVNKDVIKGINEGDGSWSMSDLVQAVVLMATFHALSGFFFGCGLTPEVDMPDGHFFAEVSRASGDGKGATGGATGSTSRGNSARQSLVNDGGSGDGVWTDQVAEMLKALELSYGNEEEPTVDENVQAFEKIETENAPTPTSSSSSNQAAFFDRFVDDNIAHSDFDVKSDQYPIFRSLDYSWQDHGYSLVNRFYPGIAHLIEEEFNVALEMTDNRLGDKKDIDTSKFRQAIWFYIHRTTGILHDDYNYSTVNKLLERSLKAYIKKLTCYPQLVTLMDFISFGADLRDEEKVHINLFAMEARKQAELLHGLRAVMEYSR
eukprot:Nk52_evm1s413 gene=Nk52_evmTU1s413